MFSWTVLQHQQDFHGSRAPYIIIVVNEIMHKYWGNVVVPNPASLRVIAVRLWEIFFAQ